MVVFGYIFRKVGVCKIYIYNFIMENGMFFKVFNELYVRYINEYFKYLLK